MRSFFVFLALITVISFMSILTMTYIHETTHQVIFANFGCESTIEPGLLRWQTVAEPGCRWSLELAALQSQNEIVGYHYMALVILTLTQMTVVILFDYSRKVEKDA